MATYLMRIGRGGIIPPQWETVVHVFYSAFSNRGEEILQQHSYIDKDVWSIVVAINELSKGNKRIQREMPASGHHTQSSDNNNFSEWLTERLRKQRPGVHVTSIQPQVLCHDRLVNVTAYL